MPRELNLKERHSAVQALWTAVNEGGSALKLVPHIVKTVLETGAWRKRQDGERIYEHATFRSFIETSPREGCGWDPKMVERLLEDDPDALVSWRKAMVGRQGERHDLSEHRHDMTESKPARRGTSRSYMLDRLQRDAPAEYEQVKAGAKSANAAFIDAGFRKRPQPLDQIKRLLPRLSADERRQLREMLE